MKMLEQLPFLNQNNLQKPLEEVKIEVDKNFKDKQEEFVNLVNHNIPKQTRFDEDADKPFGTTELNTRLNEMVAARNHDVAPPDDSPQPNNSSDISTIPDDKDISPENKNVSFTTDRLLNKLKRIEPENPEIIPSQLHNMINTIETNQQLALSNQDKIIGLLTKITDQLKIETIDENIVPQHKLLKHLSMIIAKFSVLDSLIKETHSAQA
jgi:hypothetical protein